MLPSLSLVLIVGIEVTFTRGGRLPSFVNRRFRGRPTALTPNDFIRARNPPPDQPPDPKALVRKDLLEGDIAGYTKDTLRDAIYSAKVRGFGVQRTAVRNK